MVGHSCNVLVALLLIWAHVTKFQIPIVDEWASQDL